MKKIKSIIIFLSTFILIFWLFKGCLFRKMIAYSSIDRREHIAFEEGKMVQDLIAEIEQLQPKNGQILLDNIITIARNKTSEKLSFTTARNSGDPNDILRTGKANCIGYSALFNTIANYLIKKQKLEKRYKANHLVGKLAFVGIDLHQLTDNPFWKDHDYNEIVNMETGEKVYIDPIISDYLNIKEVSSNMD